jgi:hypothetical protein
MVYTLRFFCLKCSLFHNSNVFGSCITHIFYTACAKIKKNNYVAKRLTDMQSTDFFTQHYILCVACLAAPYFSTLSHKQRV